MTNLSIPRCVVSTELGAVVLQMTLKEWKTRFLAITVSTEQGAVVVGQPGIAGSMVLKELSDTIELNN